MEPNDFQNNTHPSPKEEEKRTKKIIPFKRKEKGTSLGSDQVADAQIIVFPGRHTKTNSLGKRRSRFESEPAKSSGEPAKSSGLIGLIILILILALLLAL